MAKMAEYIKNIEAKRHERTRKDTPCLYRKRSYVIDIVMVAQLMGLSVNLNRSLIDIYIEKEAVTRNNLCEKKVIARSRGSIDDVMQTLREAIGKLEHMHNA